ncbi:DUF58 domain-containing protein [Saccharothrix sp. NPDC042600]|uniref:DUF58 domain-containing protein n=1 Tax=Saccharothrix TaxID=2071 RepID=UPI0033C04EBC|nr:hypothetical protein GCM10017745_41260 [Saccharothrix mutabilis subsp. capreolus]
MRLTARGVAVLVTAAVSGGVGVFAGYPLFLALAGLLAGAVVAGFPAVARGLAVEVERSVHPSRVERGKPALATLSVRGAGDGFTARDRCGRHVRRVVVRADAVYRYELPTSERGRHVVGPLVVERTDPLGLVRKDVGTGSTATLWVHPRRHPARPFAAGHRRHHHEGAATGPRGSLDLRDVREYVPGDEVRLVHWKSSARTGKLMVRDYADPERPRLALLVDTRHATAFEDVVEVAASVLHASAVAGFRCRLLTPGGVDVSVDGGVLAGRRLLDSLSELRVSPQGEPPARPRGGFVVVTAGPVEPFAVVRPDVVLALGGSGGVPGARVVRGADAAEVVRRWNG